MTRGFEVDGSTVRYEVRGKVGPPLVLVHGWACRRADWEGVIAHLGAFAGVIAELVHRGHLEAPIFVGHSMGAARYVSRPPAVSAPPSRVWSASTR